MDIDELSERLYIAWNALPIVDWMGADAVTSRALSCRTYDEVISDAIIRLLTNNPMPDLPDEAYWQLSFRLGFAIASLKTPNVSATILEMSEIESVVAIAVHAAYGWHEEVTMWLAFVCNADLKASFSINTLECWIPQFQYDYPIYHALLERHRMS